MNRKPKIYGILSIIKAIAHLANMKNEEHDPAIREEGSVGAERYLRLISWHQ